MVVYCRANQRQLIDAIGTCSDIVERLSPFPLCNHYHVLGVSGIPLTPPWKSSADMSGNNYQVSLEADQKQPFEMKPVLETLAKSEFALYGASIDHMIRDENWGWFASEWDIEVSRAAGIGDEYQDIALRLSINGRSAHQLACQQEREADFGRDLMVALAQLSEIVDAYYGFVDCTFFADDCSGSYYGYTPFAAQMVSVPVLLDFERWRKAGLKRKEFVRSIHWAQLLTDSVLNKLGGRAVFHNQFYDEIRQWGYPDGKLFLHECRQGLIIKLAPDITPRLIGNRGIGSIWDHLGPWLELRLREAAAIT
jgi:hypothetical protein